MIRKIVECLIYSLIALFLILLVYSVTANAQTAKVTATVTVVSAEPLQEQIDLKKLKSGDLPDTNACIHWYDEQTKTYRVDC